MAFKMKLTSKELHGAYPFSNTQTETIKKGSGGLGMAGQVPDGPADSGMANMNTGPILKVGGVNEIKPKGVDLRTGGQLVPKRGDLTEEQNDDVLNKSFASVPDHTSGKRKKLTDKDKAKIVNTGNLQGSAAAAGNELERRQGKKDALRKAAAKRKKEREANASTPTNMNKSKY